MAVRNRKGQFEKGSSGNEYGRPPREKTSHRLPARNRNAILDIAERQIEITMGGKREQLSLFEANVLRLAMDGAQGNRVSARQFAKLVDDTAKEDLTMKLSVKQLMAEMERTQAENAELRAKNARRNGVVEMPRDHWPTLAPGTGARLDDGRTSLDDD